MSTYWPAVSKRPSISRRLRPLSMTWVRPSVRGFPGRGGKSRKPLKAGIQFLQLLARGLLHVVVERVAVRVDSDRERPEVLDAEAPEALRHQLLPGDLLDLLDLRRLECGGAADDGEIHHPVAAHRLDRLVREAALAADRADSVIPAEWLGEANHPRARGGADTDRVIAAVLALAHARSGVEQECTAQVHRRLHALVEDPDLGAVAGADDMALHDDLVAGSELADLAVVLDGEGHLMNGHGSSRRVGGLSPDGGEADVSACQECVPIQNSRSYSTSPAGPTWAVARRAA